MAEAMTHDTGDTDDTDDTGDTDDTDEAPAPQPLFHSEAASPHVHTHPQRAHHLLCEGQGEGVGGAPGQP